MPEESKPGAAYVQSPFRTARHANISTTSVYVPTEDDVRHDQTTKAHKLGWSV